MKRLLFLLILGGLWSACEKSDISGDKNANQAPNTYTVADTIFKTGDNRFSTKLNIKWWADDPDGFIAGYEYTFDSVPNDQSNWNFTLSSDTTFSLSLPPGFDTLDLRFSVRAIDNEGQRDESAATIWYPIKNTAPRIDLDYVPAASNPLAGGNQLVTFPVVRFNWTASDEDGEENLSYYEVYLNDTTVAPMVLQQVFSGMTIIADDMQATVSDCSVYPGTNSNPLSDKLSGLLLNDSNTLYIRAVDLSEARSPFSVSKKIYVKAPSSNVLLVNAHVTGIGAQDQIIEPILGRAGVTSFDKIRLLSKNAEGEFLELSPDNTTQSRIFELFDHIIWFGDDLDFSIVYAQGTTGRFIDKGGNIFLSSRVSNNSPIVSSFFQSSPIDSLLKPPVGSSWLMTDTSKIFPVKAGYPTLKYGEFSSVVRPIRFINGTEVLMEAQMLERDGSFNISLFPGYTGIIGMNQNPVTQSKFVISSLPLDKLDGDGNLDVLLTKILKDEFGI